DVPRAAGIGRRNNHTAVAILPIRRQGATGRNDVRHPLINLEGGGDGFLIEESETVLIGERGLFQRFVEDAVSASQNGIWVNGIGKAQARAKGLGEDVLGTGLPIPPCSA